MKILRVILTGALVAGGLVGAALTTAGPAGATSATSGRYHETTPTRVLDTRAASDAPLGQGAVRTVTLSTSLVPADAEAAVVNVTAVNVTTDGYLTLWPGGSRPLPKTSSLQHRAGETRAASVTVTLDHASGVSSFAVYNSGGSTDLVVDVFGYYTGDTDLWIPAAASYYPRATPQRLYDSRSTGGALTLNETRTIGLSTSADGTVTTGLRAVAVNLTVVSPASSGYLQAWNGAGSPPGVSNVNFAAGRTVSNFAVIPVRCVNLGGCTLYAFGVRNVSTSAHVLVDILGWYATAGQTGATRYISTTPFRAVDTRSGSPFGRLGPGGHGTAATNNDIPTRAVNLTVTAVKPTATTYLSVYPTGAPLPPKASTMNPRPGEIITNASQPGNASPWFFDVYNFAGSTDVVVDVNGAFIADSSGAPAIRRTS